MASYREDLKKVLAEGYSLKDAHKETKRRREEALKTEAEDLEKDLEAISAEIQSNIESFTKSVQVQVDTVSVDQVEESQEDQYYMIYNYDGSLEIADKARGICGKMHMTGGKIPKIGYDPLKRCAVWLCCNLQHLVDPHPAGGRLKRNDCQRCGSYIA